MAKLKLTEKQIETQILDYLRLKKIFAFKVENGGVFDRRRNTYRFNNRTRMPGIADILGIYKGRPLAIEVKSDKGRLTEDQYVFGQSWADSGGIYFVARSIEDVDSTLESI